MKLLFQISYYNDTLISYVMKETSTQDSAISVCILKQTSEGDGNTGSSERPWLFCILENMLYHVKYSP